MRDASPSLGTALSLLTLALTLVLGPVLSEATHQPDHRFLVLGFVKDVEGRPVAGAKIVVTRLKTGLEHPTTTERDGFYLVVLHIHDEDEGERLGLELRGVKGQVRAQFDVRNKKVERGTRVDVRGDRLIENRGTFAEALRDYLSR